MFTQIRLAKTISQDDESDAFITSGEAMLLELILCKYDTYIYGWPESRYKTSS